MRMWAIALASLVAGCGTTSVTTTADTGGQTDSGTPPISSQPSSDSSPTARLGSAITLQGQVGGEQMKVIVKKIVAPAPAQQYFGPGAGNMYVAVQLRLENVGTAVYSDSPSNGAQLVDTKDQGFDATYGGTTLAPLLESPTIRPGDARVGWLLFEVPKHAKLRAFQFTLDSGFGPQAGEWTL